MQNHQSTKYLVIKWTYMEVEEFPFTTLQTNGIMELLILPTQKNYFQIVNSYWSQHGGTLAVVHFCSVLADIFLQHLYPVIKNNR